MRRRLLALLGITVFLGGSLVLVGLLTREAPPVTEAPPEVIAAPQAVPDAPPALAPPASRAPPWAATAARATSATQAWKPQAKDPSAPGKADRATRKAVRKALLAAPVEEQLARCVDRDQEVWFGGGWTSQERIPRGKPAILVLDLETVGTQMRIADVQVKTWGGASRAAVACARDALIGTTLATRSHKPAKPARHMQMTFLLSPRSGAVATAR
jgi:hypothetical protein